jgi:predicted ribosome quality control (RQC) complex YloA/Tae2 family protein
MRYIPVLLSVILITACGSGVGSGGSKKATVIGTFVPAQKQGNLYLKPKTEFTYVPEYHEDVTKYTTVMIPVIITKDATTNDIKYVLKTVNNFGGVYGKIMIAAPAEMSNTVSFISNIMKKDIACVFDDSKDYIEILMEVQ